jgi:hypothetical protein
VGGAPVHALMGAGSERNLVKAERKREKGEILFMVMKVEVGMRPFHERFLILEVSYIIAKVLPYAFFVFIPWAKTAV